MKNLFAFPYGGEILRFAQNDMKSAIYDRAKYNFPGKGIKGDQVRQCAPPAYGSLALRTGDPEIAYEVRE